MQLQAYLGVIGMLEPHALAGIKLNILSKKKKVFENLLLLKII